MGIAPGHPRSLPPTARPGQALPFTPRAVVLTLPPAGTARGLLCVWGLPAGGPGETGPEQGGICQGLKAAPGSCRVSPGVHTKPSFPRRQPCPLHRPWLSGRSGLFVLRRSRPCPCRARQQGGFPQSETQGGCQLISGRKEQQIAKCFPDKAEAGTAASGFEFTGRTSGSVGFVEEVPEKCRFSVKCVIAEQKAFCLFHGLSGISLKLTH